MGRAVRGSAVSVALVLAAIALAGCGGSSSGANQTTVVETVVAGTTTTASAGLTHEQFVAKLDAICKSGNAQAAELQKEADKAARAGDYAKLAALYEQVMRIAAPGYVEIAQLTAPPADAAAFARYKELSRRLTGLGQRLVVALRAKDFAEAKRLGNLINQARNKRTDAAVDLGTQHCGN